MESKKVCFSKVKDVVAKVVVRAILKGENKTVGVYMTDKDKFFYIDEMPYKEEHRYMPFRYVAQIKGIDIKKTELWGEGDGMTIEEFIRMFRGGELNKKKAYYIIKDLDGYYGVYTYWGHRIDYETFLYMQSFRMRVYEEVKDEIIKSLEELGYEIDYDC